MQKKYRETIFYFIWHCVFSVENNEKWESKTKIFLERSPPPTYKMGVTAFCNKPLMHYCETFSSPQFNLSPLSERFLCLVMFVNNVGNIKYDPQVCKKLMHPQAVHSFCCQFCVVLDSCNENWMTWPFWNSSIDDLLFAIFFFWILKDAGFITVWVYKKKNTSKNEIKICVS